MTDLAQDFDLLRETAREAAALALSYRNRPIARERKADGSVVTEADKAIDRLLAARLGTRARTMAGFRRKASKTSAG